MTYTHQASVLKMFLQATNRNKTQLERLLCYFFIFHIIHRVFGYNYIKSIRYGGTKFS